MECIVKPMFLFFAFQYLGCIEVLRSMRSLDFTTRSQITRYVEEPAGIRTSSDGFRCVAAD